MAEDSPTALAPPIMHSHTGNTATLSCQQGFGLIDTAMLLKLVDQCFQSAYIDASLYGLQVITGVTGNPQGLDGNRGGPYIHPISYHLITFHPHLIASSPPVSSRLSESRPETKSEHDAHRVPVVDDFVLEAVVEEEALALLGRPPTVVITTSYYHGIN